MPLMWCVQNQARLHMTQIQQDANIPGGDEEDEDSDSDDEDDVKVTIGNIKTGAPSYMWGIL